MLILLWADFAMCRVVLVVYLVYLSYLTLFSLCSYNKNKIFINSHSWRFFFFDKKYLIGRIFYGPTLLWAEFVMGRKCYGPSLLWAEMSRNLHSPNDVPPRTSAERIHSRGTGRRASVQVR